MCCPRHRHLDMPPKVRKSGSVHVGGKVGHRKMTKKTTSSNLFSTARLNVFPTSTHLTTCNYVPPLVHLRPLCLLPVPTAAQHHLPTLPTQPTFCPGLVRALSSHRAFLLALSYRTDPLHLLSFSQPPPSMISLVFHHVIHLCPTLRPWPRSLLNLISTVMVS